MLDKKLFTHPLEEMVFKEMMDTISFGDEMMYHYQNYTEKARRPDLLGKTVKATANQFNEIHMIARKIASSLSMEMPNLFIYEDFFYGVESKGAAKPWIEISAKTIQDFSEQELTFLIAKEMCGIKLEHTYYRTVVNEMMGALQNNASFLGADAFKDIWKTIMYKWCRFTCYSSDCFGYVECGSIQSAISAINKLILNNIELANRLNLLDYIKQGEEINLLDEEVHLFTKADEIVPYGPFRVKNLIAYASSRRGIEAIKTRRF